MKGAAFTAAAMLLAGAAACTPVQTHAGFVADSPQATTVEVGVDTKDTVLARLGSPSTMAALDDSAWYYIASEQERIAFLHPRTVSREVIVVRFDANDQVAAVDRFGLERGRIVAYNQTVTPTRGRELGILEQIFGNVGRGSPIRVDDEEQSRRPGRN